VSDENKGELSTAAVAEIAPLVGIGCQSRDTVMGLSGVRRVPAFAFLFVSTDLAAGTLRQLAHRHSGSQLFRVAEMSKLTAAAGREDVSVVGIKPGPLADGIAAKLSPSDSLGSGASVGEG
jgi:hypothetical protein